MNLITELTAELHKVIRDRSELLDACKTFVKHIESLPDDTEKCRHLRLALENRPGELLIEAIAKNS
jgi:hypothetical protein